MKNVLIVLVMSAFGISTAFAQTPTAVPSKGEVKKDVKAASTAVKAEAKKATDATKTAAKAASATAKIAVKETPTAAAKTAATATKSVKKATAASSTKMKAAPMAKMMYKCPKGDALCDTGGKCPKCGTEMVAISASKTKAKMKK